MVYNISQNITNAVAGTFSPEKPLRIGIIPKASGTVFNRGDIVTIDSTSGLAVAATVTSVRPIKVVNNPAAVGELGVSVLHIAEVVCALSGTIKVGQPVMCAGSNAFKAWDTVDTKAIAGYYQGHAGEDDLGFPQTNASGGLGKISLNQVT